MSEKRFEKAAVNVIKHALPCFILSVVVIGCFLAASSQRVSAQQKAISVTPSILMLDLSLDEPEAEITYRNDTDFPVTLHFSAQDFTELSEGWKVNFIPEQDAKNYRYSLATWLRFGTEEITLEPGEEKAVKIFVNSRNLTPGGHYASVLAEMRQDTTSEQVQIKGILSTLVFVRTNTGKEIEDAAISEFKAISGLLAFPNKALFRLRNSGNVQLTPYGRVEIKDMRGKIVAYGIVNEDSLMTLPESIRRYDVALVKSQRFILPGIYTAELKTHVGKSKKELVAKTQFFTQGSVNIVGIGILVLVILGSYYAVRRFVR
jgi:uncharacterized membrane protein